MSEAIKFSKQLGSGNKKVNIVFAPPQDPDVALALANNEPFPSKQVSIGEFGLHASTGDVQLGRAKFSAGAGTSWGIGVFQDPTAILDGLGTDDKLRGDIDIPPQDDETIYLMLLWGYDLQASATSDIGLGTGGKLSFAADGKKTGAFAVVRRRPANTPSRDAVGDVIKSWTLPRRVKTAQDLPPGTWILAEVNGSIAVKLGVQFGYDFNWVREAKLGGLTGDIGLKLQLAASASLGYHASGKYALALSRESLNKNDRELRLRLFKLSKKGWSFAFDAGLVAQGNFGLLPKKSDDFIKAVFGVHGAQIVQDLNSIEKWTEKDLSDALSGVSSEYVQKLVTELAGDELEEAFNQRLKRIKSFVKKWDELDNRVATLVWKLLDDKVPLQSLRDIAAKVADPREDTVKAFLRDTLGRVDLPESVEGRLLEALADKGVLPALNSVKELDKVQKSAKKLLDLLDPNSTAKVLEKLQRFVEKKLNLDKLKAVVDKVADFDTIDELLQKKLSAFLDEKLKLENLEKVTKTINVLMKKREEFYQHALKALNRKYEFKLAASYQSTTTRSALFDVGFDFTTGDPAVARLLAAALKGNFDRLLVTEAPGVTLNEGTMTYGIERQSHLSLTMPFFNKSVTHMNEALAKVTAVEDDGRIVLYDVEAKDTVVHAQRRFQLNSALTVGITVPARISGLRRHPGAGFTYAYSFKQAQREMGTAEFRQQLSPYIAAYFPRHFGFKTTSASAMSFQRWVHDLDTAVEQKTGNGTGVLGNTLISLDISVSDQVASAWLRAPASGDPKYRQLSLRLQRVLRGMLLFYYFQSRSKYRDWKAAEPLLAYAAMPPCNDFLLQGKLKPRKGYYWGWTQLKNRNALLSLPQTRDALTLLLKSIQDTVIDTNGLQNLKQEYDPSRAGQILLNVARRNPGRQQLRQLVLVENAIIEGACKAGARMHKFQQAKQSEPSKAIAELAKFGSQLTETFNKEIGGTFGSAGGRNVLRPLGTMLFVEAARVLNGDTTRSKPDAVLGLTVYRDQSEFKLSDFQKGELPVENDIVARERLVSVKAG